VRRPVKGYMSALLTHISAQDNKRMGGEGRYQNIGSGGEVVLGRYLGSPRRECRRTLTCVSAEMKLYSTHSALQKPV
jgi:hypothetical protein